MNGIKCDPRSKYGKCHYENKMLLLCTFACYNAADIIVIWDVILIFYLTFEVFMAVTVKSVVFWDFTPICACKKDVSEELGSSIIRVTRIGELGTALAVTSNRHTQHS
jgi:hypothetical protein